MAHSYVHLLVHVVFSTKERRPLIDPALRERLFPYLGGIVREVGGHALAVGGMPDHAHMLMALSQTQALADVLRLVKTNSSRWIHETWLERRDLAWQTGYGGFSVSRSHREAVERYIATQEEHHYRMTFQEEFLAFLQRHGIDYDERYIWE